METTLQRLKSIQQNTEAKVYFNKIAAIHIDLIIDAIENPSDISEYAFPVPEDPIERVCQRYLVWCKRPLVDVISDVESTILPLII